MSDVLSNLKAEVERWRGGKKATPPSGGGKAKNPYGHRIYELNMKWAETRKQALAAIEDEQQKYLQEVEKFDGLRKAWDAQHAGEEPRRPGRPSFPHTDELKKAAARALRAGENKTTIRGILGISDTSRLDEILRDGEHLLQVDEAAEKKAGGEKR